MVEENISHEFRFKNINETRNHFLKDTEQSELMSKKHKKVCTTLNYIENFLILAATITGCISVSTLTSLLCISLEITSSAIRLKTCAKSSTIN